MMTPFRMNAFNRVLSSLLCLAAFARVSAAQKPSAPIVSPTAVPTEAEMYKEVRSVVDPLLDEPVPTDSRAYNVGEMAIIPLHAAFHHPDDDWQKHFAAHFQRLMQSTSVVSGFNDLSRTQYLYFASQFLVVAHDSGHANLIPPGLPDYVFSEVRAIWLDKPAWVYAHAPLHGMKESINYKLSLRNPAKSYYRGILDWDLFTFAIAADLRTYGGTPEQQKAWKPVLDDILAVAERVYRDEVQWTPSGGWILQAGMWRDHPDFQYSGNLHKGHGLQPAPVADISWDTSHFLRGPLWITSMVQAYSGGPQHDYYEKLRRGLATQFFTKVLVPPSPDSPCYRLTNYIDGRNGLFRWGYGSLGADNGYGPYEASGTLLLGTWRFVETEESKELYHKLFVTFPWPSQCVELYLGPTEKGRPHTPSELDPHSSAMRLYHVMVYLAADL
ncbi:MAG: hypothetical protein ACLPOO_08785 [Terriglobales bacterium]|jgi:hypothetical protein